MQLPVQTSGALTLLRKTRAKEIADNAGLQPSRIVFRALGSLPYEVFWLHELVARGINVWRKLRELR